MRVHDSQTGVCGRSYAKTQDTAWQIFLMLAFTQLFGGKGIHFIFKKKN